MVAARGKRGAVLLEALVALAMAAVVAAVVMWAASDALRTGRRAVERESRVVAASDLMTAVSLWPREDLDRRLGMTRQGEFRLWITPAGDRLYDVAVSTGEVGDTLVASTLFRGRDP